MITPQWKRDTMNASGSVESIITAVHNAVTKTTSRRKRLTRMRRLCYEPPQRPHTIPEKANPIHDKRIKAGKKMEASASFQK
jgi:hypothetical protein